MKNSVIFSREFSAARICLVYSVSTSGQKSLSYETGFKNNCSRYIYILLRQSLLPWALLLLCNATELNMSRTVFVVARVLSFFFFYICTFQNVTVNILRVTKDMLHETKNTFRAAHNKTVQHKLRGQLSDHLHKYSCGLKARNLVCTPYLDFGGNFYLPKSIDKSS